MEKIKSSTTLSRNLDLLKRAHSEAYEVLCGCLDGKEVEVFDSKRGGLTAKVRLDGGYEVFLHSAYDPLCEAARSVGEKEVKSSSIAIFGLGLGYHVMEVLKMAGRDSLILIFDPATAIIKSLMKRIDFTRIFKDNRVQLFLGGFLQIHDRLNKDELLGREFSIIEHRPSVSLNTSHFRLIRTLLSNSEAHRSRRSLRALDRVDLFKLLLEGLFLRNWVKDRRRIVYKTNYRKTGYRKSLFIQLSSIGDVCYTVPVFSSYKKENPGSQIFFLTERPSDEVVRYNPYIDRVFLLETDRLRRMVISSEDGAKKALHELEDFVEGLEKEGFDHVVNLHTSPRSALLARLITSPDDLWGLGVTDSGGPLVCGHPWMHYKFFFALDSRRTSLPAPSHLEENLIVVGASSPKAKRETRIYLDRKTRRRCRSSEVYKVLSSAELVIGLNTGARFPARRWTIDGFSRLADMLCTRLGAKVVFFGGQGDVERTSQILSKMCVEGIDLSGRTDLLSLAFYLSMCRILISGDTGPVHIAASVGVKTITIAGPRWIGPYGKGHIVLQSRIPCRGCGKVTCSDHQCMKEVTPEAVFQVAKLILEDDTETALLELQDSEDFKEIEIFFSGLKKGNRLLHFYPIKREQGNPGIIVDYLWRCAILNVFGFLKEGVETFQAEEVCTALVHRYKLGPLSDLRSRICARIEELKGLLSGFRKSGLWTIKDAALCDLFQYLDAVSSWDNLNISEVKRSCVVFLIGFLDRVLHALEKRRGGEG